jgi:Tol biopolymer transport system component
MIDRARRHVEVVALVALAVLSASPARAQLSVGRNHPELDWWILESPHFRAVYHTGAEDLAEAALRAGEEVYSDVVSVFGKEPSGKLTLVVIDYDDISNGQASPVGHWTHLWGLPPKKETTGPLKWMQRATAHEFAHQVTFYSVRNFLGTPWELLSLSTIPTWYLEGVAQYSAESWDPNRDMLVRVAAANNALLPLKKLGGFVGTDQIGSRLVYEQGHSLSRYIAARFGKEKVGRIARKHRGLPISFTLTLRRTLGLSHRKLYEKWKSEIVEHYKKLWQQGELVSRTGRRVATPLQGTYGVRWSPDGERLAVVGVEEFDEEVPRLYVRNRDGSGWRRLDEPFVSAFFSWSPDGRQLVYSKKRLAGNGRLVDDLFIADAVSGEVSALTWTQRAADPAWSPTGNAIVFVENQGRVSNLAVIDLKSRQVKRLTDFPLWTDVFTPAWSPDGQTIAFSIFDSAGNREIAVINADGSEFRLLTDDPADDRYPTWSPDGRYLAFISYRNGAPNLYLLEVATGKILPLTSSPGGVFNPTFSPDGATLAVTVFERRDRVDVVEIDWRAQLESEASRRAEFSPPDWLQPVSSDGQEETGAQEVLSSLQRRPYRSWANLQSLLLLPAMDRDEGGRQFGIFHLAGDPVGKHELASFITYGKRPHFDIRYTNRQFLPTFSLSVFQTTLRRGAFLLPELDLNEVRSGVSLTALLPFNFGYNLLSRHLLFAQVRAARTQTLDRTKFQEKLKPQFLPFQGWDNRLVLGYQWSYSRPDVAFDIHPKSGALFSVFALRAGRLFKSDLTYTRFGVQGILRRELPLRENVVALRLTAFRHQGDQPLQSLLGIGSGAVRGAERSRKGDRLLYGSFELRPNLIRDLGLGLGPIYIERFTAALFIDVGKAWGTDLNTYIRGERTSFAKAPWLASVGGELRGRFWWLGKFPVVLRAGYALQVSGGKGRGWYWRIGPVF